jgi:hypothetical protein
MLREDGKNVELVRSLGADDVVDYEQRTSPVNGTGS